MVLRMADDKETEVDERRLQVLRGSRNDVQGRDGRGPGRDAAGRDRDYELDGPATDIGTAQGEDRRRISRPDDERDQLLADAADLRSRAGAERSVSRIDDDQAYELREDAAGRDDPAAIADRRRADWLSSDAARNERNARADEAEADSYAAQAETAPPPGPVEPTHDRLSPTDGSQAAAHHAVENRTHAPAARRGRTINQRTPRQREGRDR